MKYLFTTIVFSYLFGGITLFLGGYKLGPKGSLYLTLSICIAQIISLFKFYQTIQHQKILSIHTFNYGNWFTIGSLSVDWSFILDGLSVIMLFLVISVSTVTQLYSYWYLANDPFLIRFQSYLQFFTFAMIVLVLADNFALFFLGWEGVGLCSFMLIGFWSTRLEARYAALKAVTLNRVGDSALLAAIGIIISLTDSVNFSVNFCLLPFYTNVFVSMGTVSISLLNIINFMLLIAIAAKSAQLGLHGWLADAMEGPTPVSALIHAATMVTAGIYLAIRCSSLFELTPTIMSIMALLGAYTAFFGASVACFQWDIKKIVAYSTCSQLGYMLCVCGLGGFTLGFYHLLSHGFFKALLFLAAGILIHQLKGEQDIRRMGGLFMLLPLTVSYFIVGFFSLVGLPGSSGSYSKERILDFVATSADSSAQLCYSLLWMALVGTVFYSSKTFYYIFLGTYRGSRVTWKDLTQKNKVELNKELIFGLVFLVSITLMTEYIFYPYTCALQSNFFQSSIITQTIGTQFGFEMLATKYRFLPFVAIFIGIFMFIVVEFYAKQIYIFVKKFKPIYLIFHFNQKGWYFDSAINYICWLIFIPLMRSSFTLEKGLLEWFGPFGIATILNKSYQWLDFTNINRSIFSNVGMILLSYIYLVFYSFILFNNK